MARASNLDLVSTRQQRIAELAKQAPRMGFTSLNHHLDLAWLYEAFLRTRREGAPGVDGQTAAAYEADLRGNLQSLLDRAKSGTYRAPPVRRVHIPKGTGTETRPLGIPTFEDKVLQRSVVMVLSGRGGRRTRRWTSCGRTSCRAGAAGLWTWTSGNFSTRWIMLI